ncbi:MAG TPA: endonuclease/exonuclease/phosphatase family protein [Myxococcales bacterium]|jgi:hypothetical protein
MGRWIAVLVLVLAACGGSAGQSLGETQAALQGLPAQGESGVTVMTRNIYLGTDLAPLLQASSPAELPALVGAALANVQRTNFPLRAVALADEIEATQPHLIGLQEAALVEASVNGVPVMRLDYLQILQAQLLERGLSYAAVVSPQTDLTVPGPEGLVVHVVDRDVILARADVGIANPEVHNYLARLTIPVGGAGGPVVTILRGWAAVDATVGPRTFRFAATHLETTDLPVFAQVQVAQGAELAAALARSRLPLVLVGDFNSAADGTLTPTYGNLVAAGFVDAWDQPRPRGVGFTCCQLPTLDNPVSLLDQRIDIIFLRQGPPAAAGYPRIVGGVQALEVGNLPSDRIDGQWPSDHAGVVSTLRLPRAVGLVREDDPLSAR